MTRFGNEDERRFHICATRQLGNLKAQKLFRVSWSLRAGSVQIRSLAGILSIGFRRITGYLLPEAIIRTLILLWRQVRRPTRHAFFVTRNPRKISTRPSAGCSL